MGSEDVRGGADASIGRKVGVAAVMLSASVFLSSILGLLRDVLIAYFYGRSASVDAYNAAFDLPDLLNYFIVGGALSITFIPMFSRYLARDDEEGGWRLFSTVVTTMGLLFGIITLAAEVFAPQLMAFMKPGFRTDPERLAQAIWMTRIVIPAQLAFFLGGVIQSTLYVRGVFWTAALSPLIYNVAIILCGILLRPFVGIQGFSYGALVGSMLGPLALPLWAARHRIRYRWSLSFTDAGFREYLVLSLPLMLGMSLVTVDPWIYGYFASSVLGAIALLAYARKLMIVLAHMIGQATAQAALPFLARLHHEGREEEMAALLAGSGRRVVFFSVLATGGLIALAWPIVAVVYQRGAFSAADADAAGFLLAFFSLGLFAWSLQAVLARGFYARQDTLTPMAIGTAVTLLSLPVYYVLFRMYGVPGLALASSVGIAANALVTLFVYRWRTGALPLGPIAAGAARGLLLGAPAGFAAHAAIATLAEAPLGTSLIARMAYLAAGSAAFAAVAGAIALVVRPPELVDVLSHLRNRFLRRAKATSAST